MTLIVEDNERQVAIEAIVKGDGRDVILLASALRGATDFHQIQDFLADAGFRSIALNMRGAGRSTPPSKETVLKDIADDVAKVIETLCDGPVDIVGHALGNIFARATASYHPQSVRSVTVMPCGGHNLQSFPVSDHVMHHFHRCHQFDLSDAERRESLGVAFFAAGNDPGSWLDGWWPQAGRLSEIVMEADPEDWWRAGGKPMLILHPLNDAMVPPEQGLASRDAFGAQARYVEIPNCGHAILPEQPDFVAAEIVAFLGADHLR